ncbi:uncharacterized protein LOC110737331 [Chenopodium quinoa]|uniref:uncharacterized protein LOC110737331 n=1 Tax=Chenopodium quinoa TaxID=63459 RepID=UPI000B799E95|nr:uncharacterized protein LOC110737331 [Chenopodium quinoa]
MSGFWWVVEIWFYEYFPSVAPARPSPRRFPVSASWGSRRARMSTAYVRDQIISEPDVQYRSWIGLVVPGLAAQYTAERRYFLGTYGAVAYLGERVAIQHSSDTFVVPVPPPRHMFNAARLVSMLERAGTPWRSYKILGWCYEEELLPLLALVPVLAEEVAL